MFLFPSLAGASLQKGKEGQLALLMLGIEVISKQLMNSTTDMVNYMLEGSSRTWKEFVKFEA